MQKKVYFILSPKHLIWLKAIKIIVVSIYVTKQAYVCLGDISVEILLWLFVFEFFSNNDFPPVLFPL